MPSAALARADQEPPSPNSSVWDWVDLSRSTEVPRSLSSSQTAALENKERPLPAFLQRVSFHACGNGSVPGTKSRSSSRHSRSCGRSSPKLCALARDAAFHDLPVSPDARRKWHEHDPGESHIQFPEIIDAYHQQTLKLNDIVLRKNEQRRKTLAIAGRKLQQLNTVRRQTTALNNIRDKRLLGSSGNVKDLRRTLIWQARILDEQLSEENRRLATQDRKMQQLFLDMLDATQYRAWNAEISRYGEPCSSNTEEDTVTSSLTESAPFSGVVALAKDRYSTATTADNDDDDDDSDDEGNFSELGASQHSLQSLCKSTGSFEAIDDGSVLVPEWFAVLESKKCVPLLSKGKISRYVELVIKLHRLEKEMRREEDMTGLSQDGRLEDKQSQLQSDIDCRDCCNRPITLREQVLHGTDSVMSRSQPIGYGFISGTSARDQYETLLAHINTCMTVVSDRDQKVVGARRAMEGGEVAAF